MINAKGIKLVYKEYEIISELKKKEPGLQILLSQIEFVFFCKSHAESLAMKKTSWTENNQVGYTICNAI